MDFYISMQGCDTNPGTKESPFATLAGARDAVRAWKQNGISEPVTVHIGAGEYRMEGIIFDSRDSGTKD